MSRMYWRKAKTLAMLANRKQWQRDFDPVETAELEILTEQGVYIRTETSIQDIPEYIRTE